MAPTDRVALVHDYLTQRGGAERVVLAMARAFPQAPVFTSLYEPSRTFDEFAALDVRPSPLNGLPVLRRHHRLALPLLAHAFSSLQVDAGVVLCSSSGWAHGVSSSGHKVVYCHSPARWLYQTERYLGSHTRGRSLAARSRAAAASAAIAAQRRHLSRWDAAAAAGADRYLAVSHAVARSVRAIYGIEAEVLFPPPALQPLGPARPVAGLDAGFWLCVSRLLPYKNVDAAVLAVQSRAGEHLVVVGAGPERVALARCAGATTTFTGTLEDDELRWCYANCRGLVAPSFEDFGLTPLEAAAFGKPCAALRAGGYLDTVVEGETGCFFDDPSPAAVAGALGRVSDGSWDEGRIVAQAARFGEARFAQRLREVVAEVAAAPRSPC